MRKRQETELDVAEVKMLRFSFGVMRMDRIRNLHIRNMHFRCFGEKLTDRRPRGRPNRRFMDVVKVVKEDMKLVGV